MKEDAMCIKMFNLCFGEEDTSATETDIVCFEDQFLLGLDKFQGLFTVSPCNAARASLLAPIPEYSALGNDGTPSSPCFPTCTDSKVTSIYLNGKDPLKIFSFRADHC